MDKEVRIKFTEHACDDLDAVNEYIAKDNPTAAKKTVIKILDAIESLRSFPTIGKPGRLLHTRELVISSTPFVVIYQINEDTIFIIRIYHTARRWPPNS